MAKAIKITGVKKAVGDYRWANSGGYYSPRYGYLMLDRSTGAVWVDDFYSLGHNSWVHYDDPAIVNLVSAAAETFCKGEFAVNMANVRAAAERLCADYQREMEEIAE